MTTRVEVMAGCHCLASWPLPDGPCDMSLVDALAHLQLSAHRNGWTIRLLDVSEDLNELLELVGLADVLSLEPRR
jgi:hypothetical protein